MKTFILWFTFLYELMAAILSFTLIDMNSQVFFPLLLTGVLSAVLFWVLAIIEVGRASKIRTLEKILWIVLLIFIINITGLVYLILRKRRII